MLIVAAIASGLALGFGLSRMIVKYESPHSTALTNLAVTWAVIGVGALVSYFFW